MKWSPKFNKLKSQRLTAQLCTVLVMLLILQLMIPFVSFTNDSVLAIENTDEQTEQKDQDKESKELESPEEKPSEKAPSVDPTQEKGESPHPEAEVIPEEEMEIFRGRVLSIEEREGDAQTDGFFSDTQYAEVELTSGPLEGETREIENIITGNPQYDIHLEENQEVLLAANYQNGEILELTLYDVARDRYIYYALGSFLVLILLIGGVTGIKTILTLVFTGFMVIKVLLPLILEGYNPLILSVLISTFVAVVTLTVIGGLAKKTIIAVLGTIGGLIVAGFLALYVGNQASLTGLSSEEAQMLQFADVADLDLQGLLFAGIIIGALGAVMDIGMSIASACQEMVEINPRVQRSQLIQAGMNIGRDIMGTMANTLILAYAGSAMPLLLLLTLYDMSYIEIVNMDLMATEIIRALAGSIGLLVVIPLTSLASGFMLTPDNKRRAKRDEPKTKSE
ncbi:YibE/F family protein [Natranaerobius thermophilus]|uniref:YibE/F family protein n=1 Tax=Natranaerobius thermophilus (strain ATCC BAA-1301 / DSM 18059 / JW/NM-WN-LF) TaxID=457570 RepID=B2A3I4_NATTJ|nr:YibE/F family protein [Natranaerobius thermophilus]ACB86413.1 YibE/F family protein [Natranaerobius thermophilus JW/NM-WN-LF]